MSSTRGGRYGVRLVDDALDPGWLRRAAGDAGVLLVTTPSVGQLYGRRIEAALEAGGGGVALLTIPSGEQAKTLDTVESICRRALEIGLEREGTLVAFGGGVCSDLVTMAASVYRRGVRHVRVPTTLVGQVDAGIGLKAAVNFGGRKSALGTFHAPAEVIVDPSLMRTLPPEEIRAGLAEVLKMAVVSDPALFELVARWRQALVDSGFQEPRDVAREVVERSACRMLEALGSNPFEDQTYERTVDAGHTFSPHLEAASGFRMRHGEAVAVDLALSATVAAELGLLGGSDRDRIVTTLADAGLPIHAEDLTEGLCAVALDDAARHRGGRVNLPVPTRIGAVAFLRDRAELPAAALAAALARLRREAVVRA